MIKLGWAVFTGVLLFSAGAFAEGLKVEDGRREYVTKMINAQNVKGVELRLSAELVIDDCNQRSMEMTSALVSGDGEGWYDKYLMDAHISQTKMFCPLEKPVKETIYSRPVFIKSFSNENVNSEVRVSVIIPKGFSLNASEVNSDEISGSGNSVKPAAAESIDIIESEEYMVYMSVFRSDKLDGIPSGYVVLEKETKKEQISKDNWKDIDGFMIDDFNRRNRLQYHLESKFPEDKPAAAHGNLTLEVREQQDSRSGPFDTGRTYVSRVGFNRDKTEALVYVQHVATPESGIGHYVFLHKDSGKWNISGSTIGKIF